MLAISSVVVVGTDMAYAAPNCPLQCPVNFTADQVSLIHKLELQWYRRTKFSLAWSSGQCPTVYNNLAIYATACNKMD